MTTQPSTTPVYALAHHAPRSGPFVAEFSLPLSAPEVLRGPQNELAACVRVRAGRKHYAAVLLADGYAPHARVLGPDDAPYTPGEMLVDLPWIPWPTDELPPKGVAPALLEHVMDIVPQVNYLGAPLTLIAQRATGSSLTHDAILCIWRRGKLVVHGRGVAFAGMPWMRWRFTVETNDGQGTIAALDIRWPSTVRVPAPCAPAVDLLGMGYAEAIVELSWVGETGVYKALSDAARVNAVRGPWFALDHEPAALFGWPAALGSRAVKLHVADLIKAGGRTPWAPPLNPNQPGVRAYYGQTWTAPFWPEQGLPEPRALRLTVDSARTWASCPSHLLEPTSEDLLHFDEQRAKTATTNNQQPHDAVSAAAFAVGPIYKGPNRAGQRAFDSEHRSLTLPGVGVALGNDDICARIVDSYLAQELYEISMSPGWPEQWRGIRNGRDLGRTISSASIAAQVTEDLTALEDWNTASKRRSQAIQDFAVRGSAGGPVISTKLETSGGPAKWNGQPFCVPYENAQAAASQWMEWLRISNPIALRNAYELGRAVATGVFPVGTAGEYDLAYWQLWRDGEEPRSTWDFTEMSEGFEKWGAVGLIVYVLAEEVLRNTGQLTAHDETLDKVWLPHARKALLGLAVNIENVGPGELLAAVHSSMLSAYPALAKPIA